jgi:hypothetical protein
MLGVQFNTATRAVILTLQNSLGLKVLLRLLKSPIEPLTSNAYPDFSASEVNVGGYTPLDVTGLIFGGGAPPGPYFGLLSGLAFVFNPYLATPQTVYGWWLELNGGPQPIYLWGGSLDTPFPIPLAGNSLIFDTIRLDLHDCSLLPPPPPPPPLPAGLLDTFMGSAATPLTTHTMDRGAGWADPGHGNGIYELTGSNAAVSTSNGTTAVVQSYCWAGAGLAEATCTVDVTLPATADWVAGVCVRVYGEGDYYAVFLLSSGAGPQLRLSSFAGNIETALQTVASVGTPGSTHTLAVTLTGSTLTASVDGVLTLTQTGISFPAATQWGLFVFQDVSTFGACSLSNFSVTP